MKQEISAGGIVVFGNAILLLRKYNGDWVLPKGRVEENEDIGHAAVREVQEESGVKAELIKYIGDIKYEYVYGWNRTEMVYKTVHWFLMKSRNMECTPLKREGFVEAKYIHMKRAYDLAKYDDEKKIIRKAEIEMEKTLDI
ncbi:MAG: NUDIX hydrolase [Clostridiales bacterium]|nr:NUDIX hydrolase [Clostridiales bacterium]